MNFPIRSLARLHLSVDVTLCTQQDSCLSFVEEILTFLCSVLDSY